MIERVLEQLPAIRRVLIDDRKHGHLNPTWQDVSVLESINAALKPVADFTDVLSGEKHVTVSSVKPVLGLLKEEVLSPDPKDTILTVNIKKKMCDVLDEKYKSASLQELLRKATLLDPRYRGRFGEATGKDETKDQLLKELLEMTEEEHTVEEASTSRAVSEGHEESTTPPAPKKKRLCDLLQNRRAQASIHGVPKRVQADAELTLYLQEDALDTSADPLMWWRDNETRFPLISKLAKKYMCICATSTASERMFSTAGNIVTPVRCCLKPENVNMLVFLFRNL
ncbi:E3 SUMO-protein ligase ZBED1-like [Triplophysa rosa]|uniref:E3 SUMO-protein ligase ZBED1-like n=1 Tax=Triplophysa rosa TaxID=992332 RepID=UPI002545D1C8|nr:E3 SUMO-protein ligase ZBED1-like [Triplophysa rosa]